METTKTHWRRWAREQRNRLSTKEISARICQHLTHWLTQRQAARVLVYWAMDHEPDLQPLMQFWPAQYFLPRIDGDQLSIHPAHAPLQLHRWGVREPLATSPRLDPAQLDAVLIPCLAADREGYRLGYGKGYYDRLVSQLPTAVATVGVVAQELLVDRLPRDPWDRPMQYLATQNSLSAVPLIL